MFRTTPIFGMSRDHNRRGTSSMSSIEWAGRVKWSETAVGWSMCCCACNGFFNCASVLTKSVAEMTFSFAYVFNVLRLLHCTDLNEIRRRAGDVMSYTSLPLVEKDVVPFVMKGHVLHPFLWLERKASEAGRSAYGTGLALTSMSRE